LYGCYAVELLLFVAGCYFIYRLIRWAKKWLSQRQLNSCLASLKPHEGELKQCLDIFNASISGVKYFSNQECVKWRASCEKFSDYLTLPFESLETSDGLKDIVVNLSRYYKNTRQIVDLYNKEFSRQEALCLEDLLKKRNIPFNNDQLLAAVSEEDNTLVVAGAGTGKTTTILGKISYLTDRLNIPAEKILLLSFTGKAVEELSDRVSKYFGNSNIEVRTFHSFGLSIIGKVLGVRPDIAFDSDTARQKFIGETFERFFKNHSYLNSAVNYFAFYLEPKEIEPEFKTLDEYYRYIRTEKILTFQKEQVKSQQEAMIANFLYLNSINYIYEKPYKFSTADESHRQYKPDFYLPDYDIYLEHFGVDREGRVHFLQDEVKNAILSQKYQEDMIWKRKLHSDHGTKLIETFSYEFSEGAWEQALTAKLGALAIPLRRRSPEDVLDVLKKGGYIPRIVSLFVTFLDLAKSNHYSPEKIEDLIGARNRHRELAFRDLFVPIYREYEDHLKKNGVIDFHDMLNSATEFIKDGRHPSLFDYIIIDEFQDFSVSKNHMVRTLCENNKNAKLFCVGDDWQSIFRFAGSDVSLMTSFEKHHGYTNNLRLTTTNRFDSKLAKITNEFVMKNPHQIKKEISATRVADDFPLEVVIKKSRSKIDPVIGILENLNERAKWERKRPRVYFLGRYNHNKPEDLEAYRKRYQNIQLDFFTVHRSKGLEADYVILLDVVQGRYGFPSDIADDPILNIVLSEKEDYPNAEERRLMYVALTRTRNKVYIVSTEGHQSSFVAEIDSALKRDVEKAPVCAECSGAMTLRSGPFGQFWGCVNFPNCQSTLGVKEYRLRGKPARA